MSKKNFFNKNKKKKNKPRVAKISARRSPIIEGELTIS